MGRLTGGGHANSGIYRLRPGFGGIGSFTRKILIGVFDHDTSLHAMPQIRGSRLFGLVSFHNDLQLWELFALSVGLPLSLQFVSCQSYDIGRWSYEHYGSH